MRYYIRLSYNGSAFSGWQIQPDGITVQGCLQKALSLVSGEDVAVTGAGRTDAGVNAVNYVAHFDVEEPLPLRPGDLEYKIKLIINNNYNVA